MEHKLSIEAVYTFLILTESTVKKEPDGAIVVFF